MWQMLCAYSRSSSCRQNVVYLKKKCRASTSELLYIQFRKIVISCWIYSHACAIPSQCEYFWLNQVIINLYSFKLIVRCFFGLSKYFFFFSKIPRRYNVSNSLNILLSFGEVERSKWPASHSPYVWITRTHISMVLRTLIAFNKSN